MHHKYAHGGEICICGSIIRIKLKLNKLIKLKLTKTDVIKTKVKQHHVIWPPEDLTMVENPSTKALCVYFIGIRTMM